MNNHPDLSATWGISFSFSFICVKDYCLPKFIMADDGAVQWNPVTDAEKAVKEAFSTLNDSNDKVVVPSSQGKPNRFILHTKGYYGE